jgi:hypothetical protein
MGRPFYSPSRAVVSASLADQPRQRGNVRHVPRRIHASLTPLLRRALTRKVKIADWEAETTITHQIRPLKATASLVAIGAVGW